MYIVIMTAVDILLNVFIILLPVGLFLYAGYKQRPRLLYIAAFCALVALTVYLIQSQPQPTYSRDPNTGYFRLPLWAEFLLYAFIIITPLTIAFLMARFVGKKRGVKATPPRIGKIDAYLIGIALIALASMQPLVSARNRLEATLPNPEKYMHIETPVTPATMFYTRHGTFYFAPATEAEIAAAEARLGVTFPQPLKEMYLVNNGGDSAWLYVPKAGPKAENPRRYVVDWQPVKGDWLSLDEITTAVELAKADRWQHFSVPADAENWIVISHKAPHMVFLEPQGDTMRVGMVDLSQDLSANNPRYFSDFERFLGLLRIRAQ